MPVSNAQSRAKAIAKSILPEGMVQFIKNCRYRGYLAHVNYLRKHAKYRKQFAMANATAPDSMIVLPADCRIHIPSDVRFAFEPFGWSDPDGVDEFSGFIKAASGRKTLWDVGALFGVFSLAFTLTGKERRALAFEPNPASRAKLLECLRLNPAAKVEVHDLALGLAGETVEFEQGFHYTAVAGLSVRPEQKDLTRKETDSIDRLIENGLAAPDMIKIDVEGHEFEVLQGASKLLFSRKPALAIELHPGMLIHKGTSAFEIAEYLEKAGYSFYTTLHKRVGKDYFRREDNFRVLAM
jgi:FkbM family methyltransferase